MAFTSHTQSKRAARTGGDVPVLMRVDDVNVQAGTISVTISREENPDNTEVEPGQYTVQMDTSAIPVHKRQASAERATGAFYGGLVTEKMERKKGQHLLAEGFHVTAPGQATARWLNSTRAALTENRAGLVHTRQVNRNGQDFIETTGMTILDTEAFDVWDGNAFSERMRETLQAAKLNFERGTIANNTYDSEGRLWMWRSMPSTSMMFAVFDKQAQQVVETTSIYNRNPDPQPEDYPDYLGAEDRLVQTPRGPRKRSLPLDDQKFSTIANDFTQYARDKYQGQDVAVIAVRGTRTEASRQKDPRNFDMHSPASANRPVSVCHQENQLAYRLDPQDNETTQKGLAFVRTAAVRFARNSGDTYSKYATYKHSFPETGRHFLHYVRYQGNPLGIHPALSTPVNAQAPAAEHDAQGPEAQQHASQPSSGPQAQAPAPDAPQQQPQQSAPNQQTPPANHSQPDQHQSDGPTQQPESQQAQRQEPAKEEPTPGQGSTQPAAEGETTAPASQQSEWDIVDHDTEEVPEDFDTAVTAPSTPEAPEPAAHAEPESPATNPRLQGFIEASGGQGAGSPDDGATAPSGEDFVDGGEPNWLADFNEDPSVEESEDHGIDTSNNPAEGNGPVRGTKFDMPFGPM